jgi:hypothetical protein
MASDAIIATGDARTQKLWDAKLFKDWQKKSFFTSKFMGEGDRKSVV